VHPLPSCSVRGRTTSTQFQKLAEDIQGYRTGPDALCGDDTQHTVTLRGDHIAEEFKRILDDYVESHYPARLAETAAV
jgi:hypothetical protein